MANTREALVARIRSLPDELLDQVGQSIDEIVSGSGGVHVLDDEERAAVRKGIAAADRGEFVNLSFGYAASRDRR
jgi:hypothetical protein